MSKPLKLLHVYGQDSWHDPALIVGNRQALEALRDSLSRALEGGDGHADYFAGDGEGYRLGVVLDAADHLPDFDGRWPEPYEWEAARAHPEHPGKDNLFRAKGALEMTDED